jgi:hypothetical protein
LSPERGTYAFSQHVLRRIAYQTMTKRERRDRHLQVAAHLRRAFPDDGAEVAEVIAAHYQEAFTAMPEHADAETVRSQAIETFDRAVGGPPRWGPRTPVRAHTAPLPGSRSGSSRPSSLHCRGGRHGLRGPGGYEDALFLYEEVVSGHTDAERPERAAELAHGIGHALVASAGRRKAPSGCAKRSTSCAGTPMARSRRDCTATSRSSWPAPVQTRALEHAEQALALAEALELPEQLGTTLQTKGTILRNGAV